MNNNKVVVIAEYVVCYSKEPALSHEFAETSAPTHLEWTVSPELAVIASLKRNLTISLAQ